MKENAQTSKRYQRGFEPGVSRLRVRHSTTEPPRSTVGVSAFCTVTLHEPHALKISNKNKPADGSSVLLVSQ